MAADLEFDALTALQDRGDPFDFTQYIDRQYVLNNDGRRNYAPYTRQLLECLSYDSGLNALPIKVEFSFDSGATWHAASMPSNR